MVNEFCGFKHGVIGTDKMPADTTLKNMKKADLIKLLHTAQHNYETLMYFYNNAVNANMAQLNKNGWIACSERLPEAKYGESKNVLCTVTYEEGYEAKWEEVLYFDGGNWCYPTGECYERYVIAWQPLPEPYKQEKQV